MSLLLVLLKMAKPNLSERLGITKPKTEIQYSSMDHDLKVDLWNILYDLFCRKLRDNSNSYYYSWKTFLEKLWRHLGFAADELPPNPYDTYEKLRNKFFNEFDYLDVYHLIEFVVNVDDKIYPRLIAVSSDDQQINRETLITMFNIALEDNLSGFRFINQELTPIHSEIEISEISNVLDLSKSNKYHGVNTHIKTALKLLSDKVKPDYRNSIKESISAVESISRIICGNSSATISQALAIIEKDGHINEALKSAFKKLYGFSSDSDGIRHAILNEPIITQADAIFMLTSCSAFVNLLIRKTEKV